MSTLIASRSSAIRTATPWLVRHGVVINESISKNSTALKSPIPLAKLETQLWYADWSEGGSAQCPQWPATIRYVAISGTVPGSCISARVR